MKGFMKFYKLISPISMAVMCLVMAIGGILMMAIDVGDVFYPRSYFIDGAYTIQNTATIANLIADISVFLGLVIFAFSFYLFVKKAGEALAAISEFIEQSKKDREAAQKERMKRMPKTAPNMYANPNMYGNPNPNMYGNSNPNMYGAPNMYANQNPNMYANSNARPNMNGNGAQNEGQENEIDSFNTF